MYFEDLQCSWGSQTRKTSSKKIDNIRWGIDLHKI